jgi:hypothetical protein
MRKHTRLSISTSQELEEMVDSIEEKEEFIRQRFVQNKGPGRNGLLYTPFPPSINHLPTLPPHL